MPKQQGVEITQEKQFIGDGFKVSEIDGEERTVTAVISSDAIDRDGEVLLPKGADIEQFEKNPVVLWSHNSSLPPIGKALWIEKKGKKITAKVKFAATELAEEVWQLFKGGFLKAFSVGFIPTEFKAPTPADLRKRPEWAEARRIFTEWEMLEFSAVAVPANPEALATAVKGGQFLSLAKDFDLEVEQEIEEVEIIQIEKKLVTIEKLVEIEKVEIISIEKVEIISIEKMVIDGMIEAKKIQKGTVY